MFRKAKPGNSSPPPSSPGAGLRALALGVSPEELGLSQVEGRSVWGVVMDTGLADDGWHSLVVLADGTTSLYTSASFGIIGAGTHEQVRLASDALLASTEQRLSSFTAEVDTSTPAEGNVIIRALTFAGSRAVVAVEADLGHGRHAVSPVFHAAHEVITQMR